MRDDHDKEGQVVWYYVYGNYDDDEPPPPPRLETRQVSSPGEFFFLLVFIYFTHDYLHVHHHLYHIDIVCIQIPPPP
jgi:hypothetical protein